MEVDYELYDKVVNMTVVNLFTIGKDKERIVLKNFDHKNPAHLYLMEVARSMTWLEWPVYVEAPPRWVRKLNKESRRSVVYAKPKDWDGIDVPELLTFMQVVGDDGIYEKIYNYYYKEN